MALRLRRPSIPVRLPLAIPASHTPTNFPQRGSTPLTWTSSGALPGGLSLNASSGALSGIPAATGTFAFSVTASNVVGSSLPLAVSVTISLPSGPPVITNTAPATATAGVAYSHQYSATGAAGITYSAPLAVLPPGITLTSGGLLSGTPNLAGTYPFTVTATNGMPQDATQAVTITVSAPVAPSITSTTPPAGSQGTPYSFAFGASGTAPITWTLVSGGTLPLGLSLSPAGALTGTPTAAATYSFAVQATNLQGNALSPATGTHSVVIAPGQPGGTQLSLEGNVIPNPSKEGSKYGLTHAGLNGAGFAMNAWAIDPALCNNPVAPSATPPTLPAITRLWYHAINFDAYARTAGNDLFDMPPNEALIFRFTTPTVAGGGRIAMGETTNGPFPAMFVSLSTKPCDFNAAKLITTIAKDFCYMSAANQSAINFEVTNGPVGWGTCKLVPNQVYYLNLRFQDGRALQACGPALDSCASINSSRCAGLFQLSFQ